MTSKKQKAETETETESGSTSTPLDRLIDLRKSVGTGHVMTELLDILIDAQGGDSEAVRGEISEDAKE